MEKIVMNNIKLLVITFTILVTVGCASLTNDIKVKTEKNPGLLFENFKSYAWLATASVINDPDSLWKPPGFDTDEELRILIEKQLDKRGLKKNPATPDLIVGFALGVDMASLGIKTNPDTQIKSSENIPKGALVVVLAEASSGFVIWTGIATADIHENPDDETVRKRLKYAVTEMFSSIPYR